MRHKPVFWILLVPTVLLAIPLIGRAGWPEEVNWSVSDFVVAWGLMAGSGCFFWAVARRSENRFYRLGAVLGVGTGFLLTWVNLAVGFIGERNPANRLYFGVLAVGAAGAVVARFRPEGMARALGATAVAQMVVPTVAYFWWPMDFPPGVGKVFMLNAVFAGLFAASGGLFRQAARGGGPGGVAARA